MRLVPLSVSLVFLCPAIPFCPVAAAGPVIARPGGALALVPSASFAPGGRIVQDLLRKGDYGRARAALPALGAKAGTVADRYLLGNFQFRIGQYFKDEAMQRAGLEAMLATGLAAPADAARFHYYAGQFALNARDFAAARSHLLAAAEGGEGGASTQIYLAETYFGQARDHAEGEGLDGAGKALVRQGLPHLRRAIALAGVAGKIPDPAWARRGLDLARLSEDPDIAAWRELAAQSSSKSADVM